MAVERFLRLPAAGTLMEMTGFFILLRHKLPLFFYLFFQDSEVVFHRDEKKANGASYLTCVGLRVLPLLRHE